MSSFLVVDSLEIDRHHRSLNEMNHQIFPTTHHSNFPRYHQLGFERNDPKEENFDKEIHKKHEVRLTWIMLFQKQFEETLSS
ncbi:hypothetical protein M0813_05338 [Anaeramoeba flamelloides]|uniref:Uncharacterized protein n=1 Tax=Anaeramoeba flamelloides TaxID=1746091 RepID=A0ABQ8XKX9_9EUKA|nr:hypothetical protein M0813_05338 [Anaeramoeba flamelloides]